jgi:hypothetical protein
METLRIRLILIVSELRFHYSSAPVTRLMSALASAATRTPRIFQVKRAYGVARRHAGAAHPGSAGRAAEDQESKTATARGEFVEAAVVEAEWLVAPEIFMADSIPSQTQQSFFGLLHLTQDVSDIREAPRLI